MAERSFGNERLSRSIYCPSTHNILGRRLLNLAYSDSILHAQYLSTVQDVKVFANPAPIEPPIPDQVSPPTAGETSMNQVNIIGRLGADVDLRYTTTTQRAVARMSVAINDRYGDNERAMQHIRRSLQEEAWG